jgi:serine/threonine protein kinase/TolA-binding protein
VSTSPIGQTIGHYRILDQLGAGGMGVVYRAQDLKLGRQVAIKVLPAGNASSSDAIERFRREARTASALNHPNICTIYGFDEHEGQCYLAMELLDGEPLDQRLGGQPLDLRSLLDIGVQMADALEAAHSEGILHRDIKPANIYITKRGQVKVLDFGLAKLTPDARRSHHGDILETRAEHFSSVVGTTVGTIAYMSPEQARGEDLDPRTDLFSFGVVLYEMATGRQSFPGHTTAVVFDGILNREPVPPSSINTSLPADLDRIIAKALEKDRSMRYQTAADLRADLQRLRRDSDTRRVAVATSGPWDAASAATIIVASPASSQPALSTAAAVAPLSSAPPPATNSSSGLGLSPPAASADTRRAPWPLAIAGAAVLALAGSVVVMLLSEDDPPAPEPLAATATPAVAPAVEAPPLPSTPEPVAASVAVPSSTRPPTGAGGTATSIAAPTAKAAPAKPPTAEASAATARDAEAAQRLDVARAKLSSNLIDQGVADLRQLVLDYPGSAVAPDAAFLMAETLERAGRADDAMAAYVEFDQRFAGHTRLPESLLRRAQLLQRARPAQRQTEGYLLLGEVARLYPGTPQARQALQAKRQLEAQRRQLKATDPVLNTEVPALLVTLRQLAEQFPTDPETMPAMNQLAAAYVDMNRYEVAAAVWEQLAERYPGNPVEVYFQLGELYERRLRDPDKAREAYAKVPSTSPRYREAQQRLNRK